MSAKYNKKNNLNNQNNIYVVGNNAAKLDRYYQPAIDTHPERRQEKTIQTRRKPKNSNNYAYTMMFGFVIIATLLTFIALIKVQFNVSSLGESIVGFEKQLQEIKQENKKIQEGISQNMDLEKIYNIATNELGMVVPIAEQVKYINTEEVSYTQQLSEITIPVNDNEANITNVIGFISKGW